MVAGEIAAIDIVNAAIVLLRLRLKSTVTKDVDYSSSIYTERGAIVIE